ncbi:hypothetical protein Avbf_13863 [Armadillidium vulgare]|nr:hypothetical protein Avbf_13863 [Armadillidium vulgare]
MQRNNEKSKEESVAEFWVSVMEFPSRSLKSHKGLKMKGSKNSAGNMKAKKMVSNL